MDGWVPKPPRKTAKSSASSSGQEGAGKSLGEAPFFAQQNFVPYSPNKRFRADPGSSSGYNNLRRLTVANSKLALHTAKQQRIEKSHGRVTILCPQHQVLEDTSQIQAEPENEATAIAQRWGSLNLGLSTETKVAEVDRKVLADHAAAHPKPDTLLGLVQYCSCWPTFKDATLFKVEFKVCHNLFFVAIALTHALLSLGGTVKFGPEPRNEFERTITYLFTQVIFVSSCLFKSH